MPDILYKSWKMSGKRKTNVIVLNSANEIRKMSIFFLPNFLEFFPPDPLLNCEKKVLP